MLESNRINCFKTVNETGTVILPTLIVPLYTPSTFGATKIKLRILVSPTARERLVFSIITKLVRFVWLMLIFRGMPPVLVIDMVSFKFVFRSIFRLNCLGLTERLDIDAGILGDDGEDGEDGDVGWEGEVHVPIQHEEVSEAIVVFTEHVCPELQICPPCAEQVSIVGFVGLEKNPSL
jgi:hypothetical protein